jgi:hypothetical protein
MWARDPFWGIDRRAWSPLWSALITALLLESEVARAAEDEAPPLPAPTTEAPLVVATPPVNDARSLLLAVTPAFATPAAPPVLVQGADPSAPVRLDANAVLSLNEMFPFSDPLRAPHPSFETAIRTLELNALPAVPAPDADDDYLHLSRSLPEAPTSWLGEHVELNFNDGIAYKKNFTWRGMNLRFKAWGPVLKGHAGLGLRLRGLQVGDHGVELRARATTDLQDLQVSISF